MTADTLGQVDRLVQAIENAPESSTRSTALELVQAILALHGEGLKQIIATLERAGGAGYELIESLCRNDLVSSLLALHDLHPEGLRSRVERAIAQLRDAGVHVELLSAESGALKLRLRDSSERARRMVENVVLAAAPDTTEVLFEAGGPAGFVPLSALSGAR